jgi:hypothetical protein
MSDARGRKNRPNALKYSKRVAVGRKAVLTLRMMDIEGNEGN